MRTISTQEQQVQAAAQQRVAFRVWIKNAGGTYVDFSTLGGVNWCDAVTYGFDSQQPVAVATVTLRRDYEGISLAPLIGASMLNQGTVAIDVGRGIKIETATIPSDPAYVIQTADWENVFEGFVDEVDVGSDGTTGPLVLQCRDLGALLQERWLENTGRPTTSAAYGTSGGTAMETVAQQLLDDWLGAGVVTVYTPNGSDATPINPADLSGWMITQWVPDKQCVLDALNVLVNQIGYVARYRWSTLSSPAKWRLEILNPPRSKVTPDATIQASPAQYFALRRAGLSRAGVRNVIEGSYQTDANDPTTRTSITVTDATSVSRYGRKWMGITEDATAAINTSTEMNKMLNSILSDLKDPKFEQEAECVYLYQFEIYDLLTFKANGRTYDADQNIAVASISHQLSAQQARTTIAGAGNVRGAYDAWQAIAGTAGGPPSKKTWPGPTLLGPTVAGTVGGAIVKPTDSLFTEALDYYEVHLSTTSGFTPGPSTLQAKTKSSRYEITGLTPGTTYFAKLVPVMTSGVKGAATAQSSVGPGQVTSSLIASSAVGPVHMNSAAIFGMTLNQNPDFSARTDPTQPPDGWTLDAADGTPAPTWGADNALTAAQITTVQSASSMFVGTSAGSFTGNGSGANVVVWPCVTTAPTSGFYGLVSGKFPVQAGGWYKVETAWTKLNTFSPGATVRVKWLNSSGTTLSTNDVTPGVGYNYNNALFGSVLQAPAGSAFAQLVVHGQSNATHGNEGCCAFVGMAPMPVAFSYYRNAAWTATFNTWVNYAPDTSQYDYTGGAYAAGIFTAPSDGLYHFTCGAQAAVVTDQKEFGVSLWLNGGTPIAQQTSYTSGTGPNHFAYVSRTYYLNAGDTVQAKYFNGGAANVAGGTGPPWCFEGFRVG